MSRPTNLSISYLLVAMLIVGSAAGYILAYRSYQATLTEFETRWDELNESLRMLRSSLDDMNGRIDEIHVSTSVELHRLESEHQILEEEFKAYSGRDWHLVFSYGKSFGYDVVQVVNNSLEPFYLSGNEVRITWLFQSQGYHEGDPGILEITLRHANGTVVGYRTTAAIFSRGSADIDLPAEGFYSIGFMATNCVTTFIWVWDYG